MANPVPIMDDIVLNRPKQTGSNTPPVSTGNTAPTRTVRTSGGNGTTYDPNIGKVEVNAETDTVRGQLKNYTDFGSPLMKRIASQSRDKSASRGLTNTSIAEGAATGAMIDQAGKFATTDAQIYTNRRTENQRATIQLENTAMSNKTSIVNTNSSNAARVQAAGISAGAQVASAQLQADSNRELTLANNTFKANQSAYDRKHQEFLSGKDRDLKERLGNLDADTRTTLANIQAETETARQKNSAIESAWSSYQQGVANIDVSAKSVSQKTQFDRLKSLFEARMKFQNTGL